MDFLLDKKEEEEEEEESCGEWSCHGNHRHVGGGTVTTSAGMCVSVCVCLCSRSKIEVCWTSDFGHLGDLSRGRKMD